MENKHSLNYFIAQRQQAHDEAMATLREILDPAYAGESVLAARLFAVLVQHRDFSLHVLPPKDLSLLCGDTVSAQDALSVFHMLNHAMIDDGDVCFVDVPPYGLQLLWTNQYDTEACQAAVDARFLSTRKMYKFCGEAEEEHVAFQRLEWAKEEMPSRLLEYFWKEARKQFLQEALLAKDADELRWATAYHRERSCWKEEWVAEVGLGQLTWKKDAREIHKKIYGEYPQPPTKDALDRMEAFRDRMKARVVAQKIVEDMSSGGDEK